MIVDPKSTRLQLLAPFNRWDGKDLVELPILIKVLNSENSSDSEILSSFYIHYYNNYFITIGVIIIIVIIMFAHAFLSEGPWQVHN